jgi:hypothetical protein
MSSRCLPLFALCLSLPATALAGSKHAAEEKKPRDACDALSGREQLKCLEEKYPQVTAKVAEVCKEEEKGGERWECREKEFAAARIKVNRADRGPAASGKPFAPATGPGIGKAAAGGATGVLSWNYYSPPPWSGSSAPSVAGTRPVQTEKALYLERDIEGGAPASGVSADWFVAEARGEINIENPGTYNIYLKGEHSAVQLTIGSNTAGSPTMSTYPKVESAFYFEKAGWYPFVFTVSHADDDTSWAVKWQRPGDAALGSIASTLVRDGG